MISRLVTHNRMCAGSCENWSCTLETYPVKINSQLGKFHCSESETWFLEFTMNVVP